ncbi:MAG: TIGR02301 family protein [Alphaproteobacteria bacterium]
MMLAAGCVTVLAGPIYAQTDTHQMQVSRLAEILGALHHLREICGNNERQLWRDQMVELLEVEAPNTLTRTRMTDAFNRGYNDFRRTYSTCTASAKTVATRFFHEGGKISNSLSTHLRGEMEEAQKKLSTTSKKTPKPKPNQGG